MSDLEYRTRLPHSLQHDRVRIPLPLSAGRTTGAALMPWETVRGQDAPPLRPVPTDITNPKESFHGDARTEGRPADLHGDVPRRPEIRGLQRGGDRQPVRPSARQVVFR